MVMLIVECDRSSVEGYNIKMFNLGMDKVTSYLYIRIHPEISKLIIILNFFEILK